MKTKILITLISISSFLACSQQDESNSETSVKSEESQALSGQSGVVDDESQKNVVKIAIGSPDHTTLVKAVVAANLVDALSNNGPFTVFAPTNEAFDKLPKEALADLLKPENKSKLEDILYHHVIVGTVNNFKEGSKLTMFAGGQCEIGLKDGKPTIDGHTVIASVPASNGIVHIIDGVLVK